MPQRKISTKNGWVLAVILCLLPNSLWAQQAATKPGPMGPSSLDGKPTGPPPVILLPSLPGAVKGLTPVTPDVKLPPPAPVTVPGQAMEGWRNPDTTGAPVRPTIPVTPPIGTDFRQGGTLLPGKPGQPKAPPAEVQDIQLVTITDGRIANVRISASELNRLIAPNTVVSTHTRKSLEITIDGRQIYIAASTMEPAELYLTTETGMVYSLRLVPDANLPAQTIRLRSNETMMTNASAPYLKSEDYAGAITTLVKQVMNNQPVGFDVKKISRKLPGWRELSLLHKETWDGPIFTVDIFQVRNLTSGSLQIEESLWSKSGVKAVIIERPALPADQTSKVWVIRAPIFDEESKPQDGPDGK